MVFPVAARGICERMPVMESLAACSEVRMAGVDNCRESCGLQPTPNVCFVMSMEKTN